MQADSTKRAVRRPTNHGYWTPFYGNYAIRDKIEIPPEIIGVNLNGLRRNSPHTGVVPVFRMMLDLE